MRRATGLVLAAWVLTLGIDLFIHAGVMAGFYMPPSTGCSCVRTSVAQAPASVGAHWLA